MNKPISSRSPQQSPNCEKILLVLLPFWDPLIPPMGISCVKSFLQQHGYNVKAVDANIEKGFKEVYENYFNTLKTFIPKSERSNFYNIGKEVLRNHMTAHLHYRDMEEYLECVKILVYKNFYCSVDNSQIYELNVVMNEIYALLDKYIHDLLQKEKPTLLGISVYKGTLPASLFAFKLAKKLYPKIKTVMGGGVFADQLAPGSPDLDTFLDRIPYIDKIIIGEGELLFLKLLRGELPGLQRVYSINDIKGEYLDVSSLNIPDFSDFDLQYYPYLASYASRSCPFQCAFCSETVGWGKYRKKQVEQVSKELVTLYKRYGCQLFLMSDSLLNPIISDFAEEIVKLEIPIYWDGYIRVDDHACDTETTLQWRRGGFYRARLGVESGSQQILDLMNKQITPEQIKNAVISLAIAGIKTTTYWVIGYPGETEEDFQQTLDLVEELKDYIYEADFNAFWYYPGGQVESDKWFKKSYLLYAGKAKDLLILQTRELDCEPSREEKISRVNRFFRHCKKFQIPNPYSLYDIHEADERWRKLHKNSVPSLVDFKVGCKKIDECRKINILNYANNTPTAEIKFYFS